MKNGEKISMGKRLRMILNIWRLWFLAIFWFSLDKEVKKLVNEDVSRIKGVVSGNGFVDLCTALIEDKSFRNVFYFHTKGRHRVPRKITMLLFPPNNVIEISSENIGGGYTCRIARAV